RFREERRYEKVKLGEGQMLPSGHLFHNCKIPHRHNLADERSLCARGPPALGLPFATASAGTIPLRPYAPRVESRGRPRTTRSGHAPDALAPDTPLQRLHSALPPSAGARRPPARPRGAAAPPARSADRTSAAAASRGRGYTAAEPGALMRCA